MVAVAFGIPGVGKSSLVKTIISKLTVERIHWGSIAFEIARERNLIQDIDQLRKQDLFVQKEIQIETAARISGIIKANPEKHYIIETHSALKTPQGYLPGFTNEILTDIKPNVFIVYEAEPGHIYHRRMVDPSRDRSDDTTLEGIQLNLDITRYYAAAFAVNAGGTLFVIENKEADLDYAVNKTVDALSKFMK